MDNKFIIYMGSMKYGEARFTNNKVFVSLFNFEKCDFNEEVEYYDEMFNNFRFSLNDVAEDIKEFKSDSYKDEIITESGKRYSRHIQYKTIIEGVKKTSQVWARRFSMGIRDIITVDNEIIGIYQSNPNNAFIIVKDGFENLTPLIVWNRDDISKAEYKINNNGVNFVEMRDGVKLSTQVWLPNTTDIKEFPCILVRTCYGRSDSYDKIMFTERGYAVVIQDVRGREDSEGEWSPHYYERNDGDDTLTWIAKQEWCDGNIGMIGLSYLGNVQWHAASSGNKNLKALVSMVACGTPFRDVPRAGGTYLSGTLPWALAMRNKKADFSEMGKYNFDELFKIRPIIDIIPNALGGEHIKFIDDWMSREPEDEFWKELDWGRYKDNINVPIFYISGWYDDDGQGTSEGWEITSKRNIKNQKMILGPWLHAFNTTRDINGIEYSNNTIKYDLIVNCLRWFDRYLKYMNNGIDKECFVEYYQVGDNKWKKSEKWPPENSSITKMYMITKTKSNTSNGDGVLSFECGDDRVDSYEYDPQNPAPYLIDVAQNEMSTPNNYKEVELRDDVLCYTSEILKDDLAIAGEISAIIYASSSALDTDWLVRLTDVDEKGNSYRLSDGILRAKYRKGFDKPEKLVPDEIYEFNIRMSKIANTFLKGHKIRVEITSSADNCSFPNHNTGDDLATDTEYVVASQKIYTGRKYNSHINLPIIK